MAFLAHHGAANAIKDFSRVATGRGSCRCEVMRPQISFQPIEVLTASEDREGRLVLVDGNLAAVLVRLSDLAHDPLYAVFGLSKPASVFSTADTKCSPAWKKRSPRSSALS